MVRKTSILPAQGTQQHPETRRKGNIWQGNYLSDGDGSKFSELMAAIGSIGWYGNRRLQERIGKESQNRHHDIIDSSPEFSIMTE